MSNPFSVDDSPSWIVQILFGRYRSLNTITVPHLAIMAVVGVAMVKNKKSNILQTKNSELISNFFFSIFVF
jgi:hypothetical protein